MEESVRELQRLGERTKTLKTELLEHGVDTREVETQAALATQVVVNRLSQVGAAAASDAAQRKQQLDVLTAKTMGIEAQLRARHAADGSRLLQQYLSTVESRRPSKVYNPASGTAL